MATRDLGFNIFADGSRASAAFAEVSRQCDRLADRILLLGRTRANPSVDLNIDRLESKLASANRQLAALEHKKATSTIDADISAMEAKVAAAEAVLSELDKKRITPEIQVEIGKAEATIADLQAKLEKLAQKSPSPVVTLSTALFNQQLFNAQAKLAELNATRANPAVALEMAQAEAKILVLKEELAALNRERSNPKIDVDIAAAEAKIATLMAELIALRAAGGRVRIGGDNSNRDNDTFLRSVTAIGTGLSAAGLMATRLANNMRGVAIVSSLSAGLPAIISLASSLTTAAQAAALLPAVLAGAGAALLTLAIGFQGIAAALGPMDTAAQIKKVEAAMSKLSPTARDLVNEIRATLPAFRDLKNAVQGEMFNGMAVAFKQIAGGYLPIMKDGMVGVASGFNTLALSFKQFLLSTSAMNDTTLIFSNVKRSIFEMTPGIISMASGLKDFAVVGMTFMPGLANSFSKVAKQFSDWAATARADGSMELWVAKGMVALEQLGTLIKNVAHVFGDLFDASNKAGASTLSTLNELVSTLHQFLSSGQGQAALIALFQGIRQVIEAIKPSLTALLEAIGQGLVTARPAIVLIAEAIGSIAKAAAPAIPILAQLGKDIFTPIAIGVKFLADNFGFLIPLLITGAVAFKAFALAGALMGSVATGIRGIGTAMGTAAVTTAAMATRMGASQASMMGLVGVGAKAETAMTKLGSAVSRMGNSLPLIGAAVVGLVALFDFLGSHATENADKVIKGSMTVQQAMDDEIKQLEKNTIFWFTDADKQRDYANARANVIAKIKETRDALGPLAQAQADVAIAEGMYQDALNKGSPTSMEAKVAADNLKAAREKLKVQTELEAGAERTAAEAIIANAAAARGAANADLAYEQATLRIESATKAATDAVRDHGVKSVEARQAQLDLKQAYLDAAGAAGAKAEADAKARGATDSAQIGAQAYRDELLRLADTCKGDVRQALLDAAGRTGDLGAANKAAALLAFDQKTELQKLADTANVPLRDALLAAKTNFDTLGGAHATAQQKAQAQKDELLRLAGMASGPLKQSLTDMANQIVNLPNGTVNITATGTLGPISGFTEAEILRMSHGGFTGGVIGVNSRGVSGIKRYADQEYASGGVTPGYTPGRDVHHYYSRTGGKLSLSGGEAIMRPEWTAAVGTNYVHAANAAARSGGTSGVRRFMNGGQYAEGGILDDGPHQRFAGGGLLNLAGVQPFKEEGRQDYVRAATAMIGTLQPMMANIAKIATTAIQAAINARIAAAAAAAGAVAGAAPAAAGGNVGLVQSMAAARGWTGAEWNALYAVVMRESGFNNNAQNPTSTAYGMFQFLDSTWGAYGATKTSDPTAQTTAGLNYIASRYGTPSNALAHENSYGWYDKGGMANEKGFMAKLTNLPERVLSPEQTKSFERLVGWLTDSPRQSTGGHSNTSSTDATTAEVSQLRMDIQNLGETIRETVAGARPITVEDRSGNPAETGRAVSLALRH